MQLIAKFVEIKINILKAFHIYSKIENKSRKIMAEVKTYKIKKSMMDNTL